MMVDYCERTDAQIAQKVFFWVNDKICPEGGLAHISDGGFFYFTSSGVKKSFDPCNNPADAWPIISESMISIDHHFNGSYAMVWGYSKLGCIEMESLRNKVLRAAMIVFLIMQDANHG